MPVQFLGLHKIFLYYINVLISHCRFSYTQNFKSFEDNQNESIGNIKVKRRGNENYTTVDSMFTKYLFDISLSYQISSLAINFKNNTSKRIYKSYALV